MSRKQPVKLLERGITCLVLLGLLFNVPHGILCGGFLPEVTSTKLGTNKGGTHLKIHVIGDGIHDVRPHYLKVNNGHPFKATNQGVVWNGTIEDNFVMPSFSSISKGVVQLSYSLDGIFYIKVGEFVYYDGKELETTALRPTNIEGVWNLDNSIFPCSNTYDLLSMYFTPTCRDEDGIIREAQHPIAYKNACQSNVQLSIHCPIESPRRISHISLNGQDFVIVEDLYFEHHRLVDYLPLEHMENPFSQGLPTNPPLSSLRINTPPLPIDLLPKVGRQLSSTMLVCTSTDTGMGLSILMMFPTPTTIGFINPTTDAAGSFIGVGGPMIYLINVLVGSLGIYKLIFIVPSCTGIMPPLSFNVAGLPSPQFSNISSTFSTSGYLPGTSVSFNITIVDGQGIVPTGFFGGGGGPFPFKVTILQSTIIRGNNATFFVPFSTKQLGNGVWQVTCTPTRFLPILGFVTLNGLPIVNNQFNFSLQTLSASDASTRFNVFPNSSVPTRQQSLK